PCLCDYPGYGGETPVQVKRGGRFSRTARTPSATSGPVNPRNSMASEASNAGPARRSQLLSAYLVSRMASGEPAASLTAISRAVSWTASSSAQRLTSPIRSACSPVTGSQSSRWYLALAMPHSSGQTMAAWSPAATPRRVWPSMMRAVRPATEMSASRATASPAPTALDGGDHGLGAVDHVVNDVAGLGEDAHPHVVVARHLLDHGQVAAGGGRLALAADQHGPDGVVAVGVAPDLGQFAVAGAVDAVEPARRADGHAQHAVGGTVQLEPLVGLLVRHRNSLSRAATNSRASAAWSNRRGRAKKLWTAPSYRRSSTGTPTWASRAA